MKLMVVNCKDDSFTNRETGEVVKYRNATFIDMARPLESSAQKGYDVQKCGIAPGVIDTVKPSEFPGEFECEVTVGARGKLVITRMVSVVKGEVRPYLAAGK